MESNPVAETVNDVVVEMANAPVLVPDVAAEETVGGSLGLANIVPLPDHGNGVMSSESESNASDQSDSEHSDVETAPPPVTVASSVSLLNMSDNDFRSPKRRRCADEDGSSCSFAPPPARTSKGSDDEGEEGSNCPICFEPWTNSGGHRLASLRCGHLFGQSCIEKWLKGSGNKCPQCNKAARRKDIRVLYAKSIKVLDTVERDRVLRELEQEREARRQMELEVAQARLRYQVTVDECNRLRTEVDRQRQQGARLAPAGESSRTAVGADIALRCEVDKVIKLSEANGGSCRVLAYNSHLQTMCISQQSTNTLFPGYGVKMVNMVDVKMTQFVPIHKLMVRDISFCHGANDTLLLSAAMDKTVKVTNLLSKNTVHSFTCTQPVWSCTWDLDDHNYFYAGLQNGVVMVFDIRSTAQSVHQLVAPESSLSPVVSLQYLPQQPHAAFRAGGVLVGQLEKMSFHERRSSALGYRPHALPLDGILSSVCVEQSTRCFLTSYRPSPRHPYVRHRLCEMAQGSVGEGEETYCTSHEVLSVNGGSTQTLLTRSCLAKNPVEAGKLLVYAGDEVSSTVCVWDASRGQQVARLCASAPVIDVHSFMVNGATCLAALTEKQLSLFKHFDTVQ